MIKKVLGGFILLAVTLLLVGCKDQKGIPFVDDFEGDIPSWYIDQEVEKENFDKEIILKGHKEISGLGIIRNIVGQYAIIESVNFKYGLYDMFNERFVFEIVNSSISMESLSYSMSTSIVHVIATIRDASDNVYLYNLTEARYMTPKTGVKSAIISLNTWNNLETINYTKDNNEEVVETVSYIVDKDNNIMDRLY